MGCFGPRVGGTCGRVRAATNGELISVLPSSFGSSVSGVVGVGNTDSSRLGGCMGTTSGFSTLVGYVRRVGVNGDRFSGTGRTARGSVRGVGVPRGRIFRGRFLPSFCLSLSRRS